MELFERAELPTPEPRFWVGVRNALLPAALLWILVIWGVVEVVDGKR